MTSIVTSRPTSPSTPTSTLGSTSVGSHLDGRVARLTERLEAFYASLAAGHVDGLRELFDDDAAILAPGAEPLRGVDAIEAFWRRTLATSDVQVVPTIDEWSEHGSSVVMQGRADGSMTAHDGGAAVAVHLWFLQVYRPDPVGSLRFWRGANGVVPV